MAGETKYGWVRGGKSSYKLPMGDGEYIRGKSGRFVSPDNTDTTRRGEIAIAADARLMGFVEGGNQLTDGEGTTVLQCIDDLTAVFRVPLAYLSETYTVNYDADVHLGTKHDLVVLNRIQYVNLTAALTEVVIVVGGKAATSAPVNGGVNDVVYGDGYVDVRLNPELLHIASGL